ncbi:MAG: TIGR03751 family conjugal transfer lipoprotein [Parahaliea sp.]
MIHTSVMALALLVSGCANQETLIPPSDKKMVDIYRGAMNDTEGGEAAALPSAAICASLALEEAPEICREKVAALVSQHYRRLDEVPPPQNLDYLPYTRTVDNELDNLFPRLENPDLAIYVYPHLATRTRAPIPGYTTVIPLYERVEYRLPGESLRVTPTREDAAKAIVDEGKPQPLPSFGAQPVASVGPDNTNASVGHKPAGSDLAGVGEVTP